MTLRVLVSGGNRYIGLELVRELAAAGHQVTVINSHTAALPDGVERIHADRRIPGQFEATLQPRRDDFDVFFDNTAFTLADVEPMVDLFDGHLAHYVFTSTQAVYRRSFVLPIHEDFPRHDPADDDPRKTYGVNKVRCENYVLERHQKTDFPATCLRVGHTLGPRSPAATRDPIFFARLEARRPLLIPGDGLAVMQLIHINDVARMMLAVPGNSQVIGQAYNVGGAEVASVLGVMHLLGRALGVLPDIVHVPADIARRQQPPLLHWGEALAGSAMMSIDKARADTGWSPRFGIEAGYRDAYAWYQAEGRGLYTFDFGPEDRLLAELGQTEKR